MQKFILKQFFLCQVIRAHIAQSKEQTNIALALFLYDLH